MVPNEGGGVGYEREKKRKGKDRMTLMRDKGKKRPNGKNNIKKKKQHDIYIRYVRVPKRTLPRACHVNIPIGVD